MDTPFGLFVARWNKLWLTALALGAALTVAPTDARADFGLMIDAGVPDGANGSLVYRPWSHLRLHAGGSYNGISPGVRAGASLLAFNFGITPSLTVEAGHFFPGDANPMVERITGQEANDPALSEISYQYANAHLGVEFGKSIVTFYVRAGMSYIQSQMRNLNESFEMSTFGESGISVEFREDPVVRIVTPTARVGLIVYF